MRLVGEGKNEVISKEAALSRAREGGVDLIEISANANPPVCKIIDFKKFLYQEKQKREKAGKSAGGGQKEFRFGPTIGQSDVDFRIRRAEEFLRERNSVKVTIEFHGRESQHPEIGRAKIQQFVDRLKEFGKPESAVSMDKLKHSLFVIIKPT